MIKSIIDFILIPFKAFIMPNKFFADLPTINRFKQLIKPLLFLVVIIPFSETLYWYRWFIRYKSTSDYNCFIDAIECMYWFGLKETVIYTMGIILWIVLFSSVLFAIWWVMNSEVSYFTSFQAIAYASTFLLLWIIIVVFTFPYQYGIINIVLPVLWIMYLLIVISKQIHKIERWPQRIIISIVGGISALSYLALWAMLHRH